LWKSAFSVSNAGKSRGRGRKKKFLQKDLNKGQIIGNGKLGMVWPGLNAPVMQEVNIVKPYKMSLNIDGESQINKLRDNMVKRKSHRIHPLLRGWTSLTLGGRSIGPPDNNNDGKDLVNLLFINILFIIKYQF
jgi:small subunit ribosomal protein S5